MFYLVKEHNGANNVGDFVKIMAPAGEYKLGAVVTAAGALASGSAKAEYICMEDKTITGDAAPLYVVHVSDEMVFETKVGDDVDVTVGKAYQFSGDGTSITATEATGTNNGATVLEAHVDGKVRVKLKN